MMQTRSQRLARAAFPRVQQRKEESDSKKKGRGVKDFDEYKSFAKKFPALIHTCGLVQAVEFGAAKKETEYLEDLTSVLKAADYGFDNQVAFCQEVRTAKLSDYLRLSRDALQAAGWLKRYVEALTEA